MRIADLTAWLASSPRRRPATGVLLHATGGESVSGAVAWLRRIGLSYHYVVGKDGAITKCVPVGRVAFHAGRSVGWEGPGCNAYTIGVALANRNDGADPYPDAQLRAAGRLLGALRAADARVATLSFHRIVSPGRKTDPAGLDLGAVTPAGWTAWHGVPR